MAIDINISTTFLGDTDTPSSYVGQGGKFVSVKVAEDGLEFTTISVADTNIYNTNGTLTANRTVTGGGFTLDFLGVTRIRPINATSTEVGFSFRNFANTSDLIKFFNTGNVEVISGVMSLGGAILSTVRFNSVTNVTGMMAVRGYQSSGSANQLAAGFTTDGSSSVAIQAQATAGAFSTAIRAWGSLYSLYIRGSIFDTALFNNTPQMPQATLAGEVALVAALTKGRWYYLDNGDGTGTVKVKL
jgi:hypothetical protein